MQSSLKKKPEPGAVVLAAKHAGERRQTPKDSTVHAEINGEKEKKHGGEIERGLQNQGLGVNNNGSEKVLKKSPFVAYQVVCNRPLSGKAAYQIRALLHNHGVNLRAGSHKHR